VNQIVNQIFYDLNNESLYEVVQYFLSNYKEITYQLEFGTLDKSYLLTVQIISKMLQSGQQDIQFDNLFSLKTLSSTISRIRNSGEELDD
jgi:hypothetical protein